MGTPAASRTPRARKSIAFFIKSNDFERVWVPRPLPGRPGPSPPQIPSSLSSGPIDGCCGKAGGGIFAPSDTSVFELKAHRLLICQKRPINQYEREQEKKTKLTTVLHLGQCGGTRSGRLPAGSSGSVSATPDRTRLLPRASPGLRSLARKLPQTIYSEEALKLSPNGHPK